MSEAKSQPQVSLFDLETLIDPYDAYQTLRDESPVYHIPEMNLHYVTRYDLIREAIKDTATFSSEMTQFMDSARGAGLVQAPEDVQRQIAGLQDQMIPSPPTMLTLDEPDHTKYRSLVSRLFTGSQIKKSEGQVLSIIEEVADRYVAQEDVDFMTDFAFPVPLRIISDRLGIPEEDREFFNDAATAAASGLRINPITPEEMLRRAKLAHGLQELLVGLIEARRVEPREDMITVLATSKLEEEDRLLTHGEALSILGQFLVAGHETTTSTFGWGMLLLCKNPELPDRLHVDRKLVRTFVEETLRIESPVQGLPRRATRDTTWGGYSIMAGDFLMLR
jgi:cytochrome P450